MIPIHLLIVKIFFNKDLSQSGDLGSHWQTGEGGSDNKSAFL